MFFNSAEAGCGTDSNVILCDDFEDGDWYTVDGDHAGPNCVNTDGWCGSIYANPISPSGAAVCGGLGFRSNCAATHGKINWVGSRNQADHSLSQAVTELYVRFYTKPLAGYKAGSEKVLSFNHGPAGSGGIKWGVLMFNNAADPATSTWYPAFHNYDYAELLYFGPQMRGDRWYFFEIRIKLNTPGSIKNALGQLTGQANGVVQIWADDCGTTGTACTGTPTLRVTRTNYTFPRYSETEKLLSLWWENWANVGSSGERLLDQIKVSKVGPIGFMP